jgi:hypothetical protein
MLRNLFDAFSLSGAILLMLFSLTVLGVVTHQKDIYESFGSAFCAFATGKKMADVNTDKTDQSEPETKKVD